MTKVWRTQWEIASANADGSICTPHRCCLSSYFTVLSSHQCNFSITNIRFQMVLLHFFLSLKTRVRFKFFNFKLQILSAYQSKVSDKHLTLSRSPWVYYTQGLPGWTATGPKSSWNKHLPSGNFKEETVFLFGPLRIFRGTLFIKSCIFYYVHEQQTAHCWLPSSDFSNSFSGLRKRKWS